MLRYLENQKVVAICPKYVFDHVSGEEIAAHFKVKTDGEYEWPDSVEYHIKHYNVKLPDDFIYKIDNI